MAAYAITLTRQDDNGVTTASSWQLSKDHWEALVDKVTSIMGPPDETVMVDAAGQKTISEAVNENGIVY